MASDNVNLFSYTSPLTALSSYTSEKILLSQYISLTATCFGDEGFNFIYQFSGDGKNFDTAESTAVSPSIGLLVQTSVKAKWTRIKLVSTSGINQSILRVFVYATPSNSVLTAQLSGIGNYNPKVDISADVQKSAFDEILTQSYVTQASFKWDQLVAGGLYNPVAASRFASPYIQGMDLWTYSGGITTDGFVSKGDSTLRLYTNESTLLFNYMLATRINPYSAGTGIQALFTAGWHQPTVRTRNQRQLFGYFNVSGDLGNGVPLNGFFIGYYNLDTTSTELEVVWLKDGVVIQRVPQSSWNIDPCDGSVKCPNINPNYLNVFKLTVGYLGSAGCLYSMMGTDGRFYPFHKFSAVNNSSQTQWSVSGGRLGMLVYSDHISTSVDGYIESGSMSLGICGARHANSYLISRDRTITSTATETSVLAVKNEPSSVIFMGEYNQLCYAIESLRIAVTSANRVITFINIYKNITPTGTYNSTGALNNSTSWSVNETNFSTGYLVKCIPISQDATIDVGLDETDEAIRNMYWTLQPGENYCITTTSASNTTVAISLNWHHV